MNIKENLEFLYSKSGKKAEAEACIQDLQAFRENLPILEGDRQNANNQESSLSTMAEAESSNEENSDGLDLSEGIDEEVKDTREIIHVSSGDWYEYGSSSVLHDEDRRLSRIGRITFHQKANRTKKRKRSKNLSSMTTDRRRVDSKNMTGPARRSGFGILHVPDR